MAKPGAVWGIDIGQCALKALRCRAHEKDSNRIVVEAFDYIEYPKLLSQQDANREELIAEALETFLSRNEVKGDSVAISVPGQSGLARFVKLPPVEQKKIPDIVKFEAKQQIPFALEDVVWDYQALAGGSQDEGFALETEVGLFAMKRDQVARALEPLEAAGIEVETIQLAPLAVYNFTTFDRLGNLEDSEGFEADNQPPSIVVLSFGAETTDLVVTNGYRVWQRNIPIGGSHFTKALAKEMRITFAKAEHLKRNATQADDPKAVFQAMRPVFSDLVTEIQRSIGFYQSNNRKADLKEIITLGNPMKLPGLQRYLDQNLEQPVTPISEYSALVGGSVTAEPQFKDNHLSFAVAYGLCVQGLGSAKLSTSLLPEEIITTRLIRSKKPWAVAAAAALFLALAINYFGYVASLQTAMIDPDRSSDKRNWHSSIKQSEQLSQTAGGYSSTNSQLRGDFERIQTIGVNLQSNADGRLLWLEMLKAIDACVPKDDRPESQRKKTVKDVSEREELHIESMECQYFTDLGQWFNGPVQKLYADALKTDELAETAAAEAAAAAGELDDAEPTEDGVEGDPTAEPAQPGDNALADATGEPSFDEPSFDQPADPYANPGMNDFGDAAGGAGVQGPTGPGWVIQLVGYHFHNSGTDPNVPAEEKINISLDDEGARFVRRTLIRNLLEGSVELLDSKDQMLPVSMEDLGIAFPVLMTKLPILAEVYDPEAMPGEQNAGGMMLGMGGGLGEGAGVEFGPDGEPLGEMPERWKLRRYDFVIQFVWTPKPRGERERAAEEPEDSFDDFSGAGPNTGRIAVRVAR